jgi:hypothetical protein
MGICECDVFDVHISQGKQLDPCECVEEALQCPSLSPSAKEVG